MQTSKDRVLFRMAFATALFGLNNVGLRSQPMSVPPGPLCPLNDVIPIDSKLRFELPIEMPLNTECTPSNR
jgi:hypothetical protein